MSEGRNFAIKYFLSLFSASPYSISQTRHVCVASASQITQLTNLETNNTGWAKDGQSSNLIMHQSMQYFALAINCEL